MMQKYHPTFPFLGPLFSTGICHSLASLSVIPAPLCHSLASLSVIPTILFLSFPRRRESSFTISWIPFFKGMTRWSCHSHDPLPVIPAKAGI
ncbi:MAG: hypothetical protein SFT68_02315 [Rickettsiaceae bacterium]|nr:hypothetical protein [Rickettsiaceae bacterium]